MGQKNRREGRSATLPGLPVCAPFFTSASSAVGPRSLLRSGPLPMYSPSLYRRRRPPFAAQKPLAWLPAS